MQFSKTNLPDVLLIEPTIYGDDRGFFSETFREDIFAEQGITDTFVQDNHSRSEGGVLRGLHYQLVQPQGKIVSVSRGRIFDVAVDIRSDSPTFGQWTGQVLDDVNFRRLYIPKGFAHGFVVLSDTADILYKCSDYYHPDSEQGVAWNDKDIGIEWPMTNVNLSQRDQLFPPLAEKMKKDLPLTLCIND